MARYDVQQVCLNGHQITSSYNSSPEFRKQFCDECGEETIHKCPSCQADIKGYCHVDGLFSIKKTPVPTHCENCGEAFPWTKKKALAAPASGTSKIDPLNFVELLCSKFHVVARQLRSRYSDRDTLIVNDEYDVQDLLHSLLRIYFDDIRDEEWNPSYAGASSRVDFLLKAEQIVIEVKKTRQTLKAKQLGDELIIDIQKYQTHPDCKTLVCFVYDPEDWITNPRGLESDLNKYEGNIKVKTIIVPKGY